MKEHTLSHLLPPGWAPLMYRWKLRRALCIIICILSDLLSGCSVWASWEWLSHRVNRCRYIGTPPLRVVSSIMKFFSNLPWWPMASLYWACSYWYIYLQFNNMSALFPCLNQKAESWRKRGGQCAGWGRGGGWAAMQMWRKERSFEQRENLKWHGSNLRSKIILIV